MKEKGIHVKNKKVLKLSELKGTKGGLFVYFESYFHPRIGVTKMMISIFLDIQCLDKNMELLFSHSLISKHGKPFLYMRRLLIQDTKRHIALHTLQSGNQS